LKEQITVDHRLYQTSGGHILDWSREKKRELDCLEEEKKKRGRTSVLGPSCGRGRYRSGREKEKKKGKALTRS